MMAFFKNANKKVKNRKDFMDTDYTDKGKITITAQNCREAVEKARSKKEEEIENRMVDKIEKAINHAISEETFSTTVKPFDWFVSEKYNAEHLNGVFHEKVMSSLEKNGFNVQVDKKRMNDKVTSLNVTIKW